MAERTPGPTCLYRGTPGCDEGTSALTRTAAPHHAGRNHRSFQVHRPKNGKECSVVDLQKQVRPILFSYAYAKAAAVTDDRVDTKLYLQNLKSTAEKEFKALLTIFFEKYHKDSASAQEFLRSLVTEKQALLDKYRQRMAAEQHSQETRLHILNIIGFGLHVAKAAGVISTKILKFVAPPAGEWLDDGYLAADVAADIQGRGATPMLVVISKDAAIEGAKRSPEAAEKASEHLAEHVERHAYEAWSAAMKKGPFGSSRATKKLISSFDTVGRLKWVSTASKYVGKKLNIALVTYDIWKELKDVHESFEQAFGEHEAEKENQHLDAQHHSGELYTLPPGAQQE
jgi:hypothetical protein